MEKDVVTIRKITLADTENIVRWRNSPQVLKNFIDREPLTAEKHIDWFTSRIKTGDTAQFIIHLQSANADIGTVFLRDISAAHQKAEFGIFIGESLETGKGYGTQAARLILQYAFEELNLNKVTLRVFEGNTAARRSYEKLGFQIEGIFFEDVFLDAKPENVVYMAVFRQNFTAGQDQK